MQAEPQLEQQTKVGAYRLRGKPEPLPRHPVRITVTSWSGIMSYVLSLIVAATVLGATQAGSEEVGLGVSVRWVDNGVTVEPSLNRCYDTDWNTAAIKEGESEPAEMIAIIER